MEGSISGRVWDLSQRSKGCRHVQASLDAASDAERAQLASELRGRIFAAARSACANYVLQKIIHVLRVLEISKEKNRYIYIYKAADDFR